MPAELAVHPISGHYNLEQLRSVHRHLFADLYEWAGELRTVAIAKGDMFCLAQHIESYAAPYEEDFVPSNYWDDLGISPAGAFGPTVGRALHDGLLSDDDYDAILDAMAD